MSICSPVGLAETVNIQVSNDEQATAASSWFPWFDGGPPAVQQTVPAAGNAQPYPLLVLNESIRLVATTPAAADRVFWLQFQATT